MFKKSLVVLISAVLWTATPALAAETAAVPQADAPAASKEDVKAPKKADYKKPSEEAAKTAKEADKVTNKFDPQTYTCATFSQDMAAIVKGTDAGAAERIGIALIWTHGYYSAIYGTDESGPLNSDTIGSIAEEYTEYCKENPGDTYSRATNQLTSDEE